MSNITVTHAASGLIRAEVVRSARLSPHLQRVTLGGDEIARFQPLGFDQWVRLALPKSEETRFDNLSDTFGLTGYLRYSTLKRATRPFIRNYTISQARPELAEVDLDFVIHGDEGVAGPWAQRAAAGDRCAFIDQGCGWNPVPAPWVLLIGDESALPAIAGILRDLPRATTGHAIIELFDDADRRPIQAPDPMIVHWLVRKPEQSPGAASLPALRELALLAGAPYAFAVGEQALATGARRFLVNECGVPKTNVTFSGYWRIGRASPG